MQLEIEVKMPRGRHKFHDSQGSAFTKLFNGQNHLILRGEDDVAVGILSDKELVKLHGQLGRLIEKKMAGK